MTDSTDLPREPITQADVNKAAADISQALKDGVYVAIGLGVLGFQRAQVQRVELTRQLESWLGPRGDTGDRPAAAGDRPALGSELTAQLSDLAGRVDEALAPARDSAGSSSGPTRPVLEGPRSRPLATQLTELAKAVDERVQPVRQQLDEQFDLLEQYLPPATRNLVQSWRAAAAEPEQRLRSAVGLD